MSKQNTIGLDTRILTELVQTGLSCPAFNPRMKYCFAWYSQDAKGIQGLDHDWCLYFPFDTLTYVPGNQPTAIKVCDTDQKLVLLKWSLMQFLIGI